MRPEPHLLANTMSVRDVIAMHAMAAILASSNEMKVAYSTYQIAECAVRNADELIAELQKQDDEYVDRRHD